MAWPEVETRLVEARNYWVCTISPDGRPHAAPVWGVWLDGELLFSSDPASVKARNLSRQPETVVHLESGDDVVILEGRIVRLAADDSVFAPFVSAYDAKYGIQVEAGPSIACFRLRPRKAMAWLESDFPQTATRWRFGQAAKR